MLDPFEASKRSSLQQRQERLIEDYERAQDAFGREYDDVKRTRIERQIEYLEQEIAKTTESLKRTSGLAEERERQVIEIPIAVIAMTRGEAEELHAMSDTDDLQHLNLALRTFGITDVTSCYRDNRDDWTPLLADPPMSIKSIINDLVDRMNDENSASVDHPTIQVRFISTQFSSTVPEERQSAWSDLEKYGGILIVDAISMYNHQLRDNLLRSSVIGQSTQVGMIVVSPLRSEAVSVHRLLREQIYSSHLEKALFYFADLRQLYEFDVTDVCYLQRWLYAVLPTFRRTIPNRKQQQGIFDQSNIQPAGLAELITGII